MIQRSCLLEGRVGVVCKGVQSERSNGIDLVEIKDGHSTSNAKCGVELVRELLLGDRGLVGQGGGGDDQGGHGGRQQPWSGQNLARDFHQFGGEAVCCVPRRWVGQE